MKIDEIRRIFWLVLLMPDRDVSGGWPDQLDQVLKLGRTWR